MDRMQASEQKKTSQGKLIGNIAILAAMTITLVAPAKAQTWQKSAPIPVVVENTACNASTDTVGITADFLVSPGYGKNNHQVTSRVAKLLSVSDYLNGLTT